MIQAFRILSRTLIPATMMMIAQVAFGQPEDGYAKSFTGVHPPELSVPDDGWVNFEGNLSLEKLRGHVVWLEFSFINCGGCQMMKPILQGIQHRYGPDGLVVVEVNNGQVDTREALVAQVNEHALNYPVLWDEEQRTCSAYEIKSYGTAYLIGADGKVIWGGNPLNLTVLDIWKMIYYALREVNLDELKANGDQFLRHQISTSGDPQYQEQPLPAVNKPAQRAANDKQYSIGADYTVCTADNSMLIDFVAADGPADHAGLQVGDTVVGIDTLILSEIPFEQLKTKLHQLDDLPRPFTFTIKRDERLLDITITPARKGGAGSASDAKPISSSPPKSDAE